MKYFTNMKYKCLLILLITVSITGCSSKDINIRKKIECLKASPIILPTDSMEIIKNEKFDFGISRYLMISYLDSANCTNCEISHLYLWNHIIKKSEKVSFFFIFETKSSLKSQFENLTDNICDNKNVVICIDTLGIFKKANPMLPQESFLHTFLLDSTNHVVIVGNPLKNSKIKELYFDCIRE